MASAMLELSEVAGALFRVLVTSVQDAAIRVAMEAVVVHGDHSPAEQMETVRGILKMACISGRSAWLQERCKPTLAPSGIARFHVGGERCHKRRRVRFSTFGINVTANWSSWTSC